MPGNGKCYKRRYRSDLDAQIAMASIDFAAKKGKAREECRIYFCDVCGGFHITSMTLRNYERSR